jgi:hypothetical protein
MLMAGRSSRTRELVLAAVVFAAAPTTAVAAPQPKAHVNVADLIGRVWQREIPPAGARAPELVTWEFYANGTFRRQLVSDHSASRTGAWHDERGVLFLASESRFDALSIELEGEKLKLGEFDYRADPSPTAEPAPHARERDRHAVDEERKQAFSSWIAVTGADWRSEPGASSGDPDEYSFARDGTYSAAFDVTDCRYEGSWSSSFSEGDRSFVRLSVPTNDCDPRGPRQAFVREVPARWEARNLILNDRIYVPVTRGRR